MELLPKILNTISKLFIVLFLLKQTSTLVAPVVVVVLLGDATGLVPAEDPPNDLFNTCLSFTGLSLKDVDKATRVFAVTAVAGAVPLDSFGLGAAAATGFVAVLKLRAIHLNICF